MPDLQMVITLLSDTTFGRGDGMAGVVDQEIEHDPATGLPIIKGRTLKGLLVEECANILFALELANCSALAALEQSADRLFGVAGSGMSGQSLLHIGTARLPAGLDQHIRSEIAQGHIMPHDVLESLTAVRQQTAVDYERDTPKDNTLRAMRVILRKTVFCAPIMLREVLSPDEAGLLAACAAALHRAGHSRNRGRGRIAVSIDGLPTTALDHFVAQVKGG